MRKHLLHIIALLLLTSYITTAHANGIRTIRVGFCNIPGYEMTDEDGIRSGYGYDFLLLLQRYADVKIEYIGQDNNRLEIMDMLRRGEIDMVTMVHKTPERMLEFEFTSPIGESASQINVRADNQKRVPLHYETFNGMKTGLLKNNSINKKVEDFAKTNGFHLNYIYYDNHESLKEALTNGEIEAIATGSMREGENEKTIARFESQYFYAAIKKGDIELRNIVNNAIDQMNTYEGNWQSYLFYKNYSGVKSTTAIFTPEEQAFIKAHSTDENALVVSIDRNWPPFSYVENDVAKGIIPDYWQKIADMTGMKYRYYISDESISDHKEIQNRDVDIYLCGIMDDNSAENKGFLLSPVYLHTGASLLYLNTQKHLNRIALCDNTPELNKRLQLQKGQVIQHYADTKIALNALREGEVDAIWCYTFEADHMRINSMKADLAYHIVPGVSLGVVAVSSIENDHTLMSIVSKCINKMPSTDIESIVADNISKPIASLSGWDWVKANPRMTLIYALIVIVLLALVYYLYQTVKSKERINKKTKQQLDEINKLNSNIHELFELTDLLSHDVYDIFILDLSTMNASSIKVHGNIIPLEKRRQRPYEETWKWYIENYVYEEDKDTMRLFVDIDNIKKQLEVKPECSCRFRLDFEDKLTHFQTTFTYANEKEKDKIVFAFRSIEQLIKEELENNRQLEIANQAKSTFLFTMSHDIRTPMNAIVGYAELMEQQIDNKEKTIDYLAKLKQASKFLTGLINNILEMARIESGKMELDEQPTIIANICHEVDGVFGELMKKKGINYSFNQDVQVSCLYVDAVKIKEMFMNLVSNAYKYTPEGGSVSIFSKQLPGDKEGCVKIRITVSDTGIGMSKEFLPTIWNEFTRERTYTENKIEGTGLGLPIVKKIVDMMGGTITVESEVGKGTTFTVTCEHRVADEKLLITAEPKINKYEFKGKHILLAEDNDLNAEISIELLSAAGFTVDRAEDGVQCVNMLNNAPKGTYDLILMDVQMPNMDGYKTTETIRHLEDKDKARIPIIALTANAFDTDKKNALAAGMNGHLAKPIDVKEVMKTLKEILV